MPEPSPTPAPPPAPQPADPSAPGAAFEPITSQEQLDRVFGDRAKRIHAQYADYPELLKAKARLDELEQAGKSELEKAQQRVAELEATTQADAIRMQRLQVIADHRIPAKYQALINGPDAAAMNEQAAQVQELIDAGNDREDAQSRRLVVPGQGRSPELPLNGSGLEDALRQAIGAA